MILLLIDKKSYCSQAGYLKLPILYENQVTMTVIIHLKFYSFIHIEKAISFSFILNDLVSFL